MLGEASVARGYFCCSSDNVTDEMIAKYIAEQNIEQDEPRRNAIRGSSLRDVQDEDFRVDG